MAHRVTDEDAESLITAHRRLIRSRSWSTHPYDWDTWAEEGGWWEFRKGEDFTCTTASFCDMARQWGRAQGYQVTTRHIGNGRVLVRFTDVCPPQTDEDH